MRKFLITFAVCLLVSVASAQLPVSVRTTNGTAVALTVTNSLVVTNGGIYDGTGLFPAATAATPSPEAPLSAISP